MVSTLIKRVQWWVDECAFLTDGKSFNSRRTLFPSGQFVPETQLHWVLPYHQHHCWLKPPYQEHGNHDHHPDCNVGGDADQTHSAQLAIISPAASLGIFLTMLNSRALSCHLVATVTGTITNTLVIMLSKLLPLILVLLIYQLSPAGNHFTGSLPVITIVPPGF